MRTNYTKIKSKLLPKANGRKRCKYNKNINSKKYPDKEKIFTEVKARCTYKRLT